MAGDKFSSWLVLTCKHLLACCTCRRTSLFVPLAGADDAMGGNLCAGTIVHQTESANGSLPFSLQCNRSQTVFTRCCQIWFERLLCCLEILIKLLGFPTKHSLASVSQHLCLSDWQFPPFDAWLRFVMVASTTSGPELPFVLQTNAQNTKSRGKSSPDCHISSVCIILVGMLPGFPLATVGSRTPDLTDQGSDPAARLF